jgi:hypothetical protein
MKTKILLPLAMTTFMVVTACSSNKKEEAKETTEQTTAQSTQVSQEGLDRMTASWPESSQAAIISLNTQFGLPDAVTEDLVIWNNTPPFKRTIVYREEVKHKFPMEHSDIMMQTVDYRVPVDKVTALSKFDGSLLVDRTKGELSARNDKQEMNILALNLADKIVRGQLTVEQARREYSKNAEAFSAGTSSPLVSSLTFKTEGTTSDPDTMMQSQESKTSGEKTKSTKEAQKVIEE